MDTKIKMLKKNAWNSWGFRLAVFYSIGILFIAVFAPFLANDLPLLIVKENTLRSPVVEQLFSENYQQNFFEKDSTVDFIVYPLVKWSPGKSDFANADFKSPFDKQYKFDENEKLQAINLRDRHWLGTGLRGNDVLAGIIHGANISIRLGFLSVLLSAMLGIIIGGVAAWFGNGGLQCRLYDLLFFFLWGLGVFHIFSIASLLSHVELCWSIFGLFLFGLLLFRWANYLEKYRVFNKVLMIPIDSIILRFLEFFTAFPKIVLILVVAVYWKPSFTSVLFLLVMIGWADFARFVRGEILRIKSLNFVDAARLSGARSFRIIIKHILPNALVPLLITFIYLMATNMLIEAGLSFLGAGMPANIVTWGSLIADGRENIDAWWLIIFPGLTLTFCIAAFYRIAREFHA